MSRQPVNAAHSPAQERAKLKSPIVESFQNEHVALPPAESINTLIPPPDQSRDSKGAEESIAASAR